MSPEVAPLRHADRCCRCLFMGEYRKCLAHRQGDAIDQLGHRPKGLDVGRQHFFVRSQFLLSFLICFA
jgi:hypothetical protein